MVSHFAAATLTGPAGAQKGIWRGQKLTWIVLDAFMPALCGCAAAAAAAPLAGAAGGFGKTDVRRKVTGRANESVIVVKTHEKGSKVCSQAWKRENVANGMRVT